MSAASALPDAPEAKAKSKRTRENDTGLHVLKGALVRVLGPDASLTSSVRFDTAFKATLVLVWPPNSVISPERVVEVECEANRIISADVPIEERVMEREKAEEHYRKHPVNDTFIYDAFPVPSHVTQLTICHIEGVNVNCCPGPHVTRTSDLIKMKVLKTKKSKTKDGQGAYEFSFAVGKEAVRVFEERNNAPNNKPTGHTMNDLSNKAGKNSASSPSASLPPSSSSITESDFAMNNNNQTQSQQPVPVFQGWQPGSRSRLQIATENMISLVHSHLKAASVTLSPAATAALHTDLERQLLLHNNAAYTAGYEAAAQGSHLKMQQDRARLL